VRNSVNHLDWFCFFFAVFLSFSYNYAGAGELDGNVYVGPTGMQGSEPEEDDEVSFNNGELYSSGCAAWGFKAGAYTTEKSSDGLKFTATTLSPDDGKIVWEGIVRGNEIEATYTWTKERWWWADAKQIKWFKGKLKP